MLDLAFGPIPVFVELSAVDEDTSRLQRLRLRFPDAQTVGSSRIRVGIDSFLSNLDALSLWQGSEVRWNPRLLQLVEDNYKESQNFETVLADGRPEVAAARVSISGWDAPLTDLQHRDIRKLSALTHGANFSVPGAGKTRVSLALLAQAMSSGEVRRALVVAPKSAFEAWQSEAELCSPDLTVQLFGDGEPLNGDLLLVNYERLPTSLHELAKWTTSSPTMVILDEAHRMKLGEQGAWGSACYALGNVAQKRLILSGTPAPNGSRDLENLFGFVWPGQGRRRVRQAVGSASLEDASIALKPLYARTTKSELKLPPMRIRQRRVILPPLHRQLYDALIGQSAVDSQDLESLGRVLMYLLMATSSPALLAAGGSRHEPLRYRVPPLSPPAGSTLSALLAALPDYELSPKYAEVIAMVRSNAQAGRKTLVWSTFVRNLTTLRRLLHEFQPALVHGGTEDRATELERFREDPDCFVLLSNPATLGEGISLHQVCHDAIYVDRDFAAGKYLQSLDRIHRLGLGPEVETNVTVLVADSTIDEVVAQRLDVKVAFLLGILDDPVVHELTDLDEEPAEVGGMDSSDMGALMAHLKRHGASS